MLKEVQESTLKMKSLVLKRFNIELSEAMAQIDKLNLIKLPKLIPTHMTDEELARLRFTWVSSEGEISSIRELK